MMHAAVARVVLGHMAHAAVEARALCVQGFHRVALVNMMHAAVEACAS